MRRGGFHRLEKVRKQLKPVILAPTLVIAAQNSKFLIQNLRFRLFVALLTSNIYAKRVRRMDAERLPQKRTQISQNSGARTSRYSSKFKFLIQNLNCKPLDAVLTSNITSMKRLGRLPQTRKQWKTAGNSEMVIFGAKTSR